MQDQEGSPVAPNGETTAPTEFFPLPELVPVPLSRFEPEVVEGLELTVAAEMPDGEIWAMGRDGATYCFPSPEKHSRMRC